MTAPTQKEKGSAPLKHSQEHLMVGKVAGNTVVSKHFVPDLTPGLAQ